MQTPPVPPPAERFAALLQWLSGAVATRGVINLIASPVLVLIIGRIRTLRQRFAELAARIQNGTYRPRRSGPRKPSAARKPRRPNALPADRTFGWLLPLVPDATGSRSQLEFLLRDPQMLALIQAAPGPMGRLLRPLCWMLRLKPPPILAAPRRVRPERPPPAPRSPPPAPPRVERQSHPKWPKLPGPRYPKGCA